MANPIFPSRFNATTPMPAVESEAMCIVPGGRPGMTTCCERFGNSTVQVVDDCWTWYDVSVPTVHDPNYPFFDCIRYIAPVTGYSWMACQTMHPSWDKNTTWTTATPSPISRPTPSAIPTSSATQAPARTNAAAPKKSISLMIVLVSTILVGGLMSSGALFNSS
ncbi:uncharacterized protein K489DRAFT_410268 [Dissoconium aciculare CBS 342.82]|uniref:Uncharacterized protein n=1 Tax=Dissoconium aciculare CBS 342.82 TaxID=1314786 RepID=A0A6J3M6S3_9PEZI|nr:uncharacterized protein K489DRAFT_410268 [Dissoconium aciculare CBS 342.82]KAF1823219.1 hypothetical protein K489DRAFT_410268 [Dissoconium aciculare CBS 342.82]